MESIESVIVELCNEIHISCEQIEDLDQKIIQRDTLLTESVANVILSYKEKIRPFLKSDKYSCLHSNSTSKQKYPSINLLRQILKAVAIHMKPIRFYDGYDKSTGKKIIQRAFILQLTASREEEADEHV